MALLTLNNVSVRLDKRAVLENVSFSVKSGEFVVIVGPNGAGKTTLLKAAAHLLAFDGDILLKDKPLQAVSHRDRAQMLAYLPQGHVVHWPMTVRDIVALGRLPHLSALYHMSEKDADYIEQALTDAELDGLADRRIDTLSGGERARVMIARGLASQAPLLLADEPTASLDPYHQLRILELMQDHARKGTGVVAVLHDLVLAAQFADRITLLHEGRIVTEGLPEEVLTPDQLSAVYRVCLQTKKPQETTFPGLAWQRITKN